MSDDRDELRTAVTVTMGQTLGPTIANAILSSVDFRETYGVETEYVTTFQQTGVSFNSRDLHDTIRKAFVQRDLVQNIEDVSNKTWCLSVVDFSNGIVEIRCGDAAMQTPEFWHLIPDIDLRLKKFRELGGEVNLSGAKSAEIKNLLSREQLRSDDVVRISTILKNTPVSFAQNLSRIFQREVSLSALIPKDPAYYDMLVGMHGSEESLPSYLTAVAEKHIEQLISWHPHDGLLQALLMSSHLSIVDLLQEQNLNLASVTSAFELLSERGDLFSQLGALEFGIRNLQELPELEEHLIKILNGICATSPQEPDDRFRLLSSLMLLVDGEFAFRRMFSEKPPFWRRLACIAHASQIERYLVCSSIDISWFTSWAIEQRGRWFYTQTICDLRLEPRWQPELAFPEQLKAEFLGRIVHAAEKSQDLIEGTKIFDLISGDDPNSVTNRRPIPASFFPGPLEGRIEEQTPVPVEIADHIEQQLAQDKLEVRSFASLINSALMFNLDEAHAAVGARALKEVKYYLKSGDTETEMSSVLTGLAIVAATTRSTELAEDLRILTRRFMQRLDLPLSVQTAVHICLVAAAAHANLDDWADFLGNWITELTYTDMTPEEVSQIRYQVETLLEFRPALWANLGCAEAALSAIDSY